MKLNEMMELLRNSDTIHIRRAGKTLYAGYKGILLYHPETGEVSEQDYNASVTEFKSVPEIRHRKYDELGLMEPLRPEIMPMYKFTDLQMTLYYEITIA